MKIQRKNILIVGLSSVQHTSNNTWITKTSIAEYINELAQQFDECTWITYVSSEMPSLQGNINSNLVKVVPLQSHQKALFNWLRLIAYLRHRPYVILYFPAFLSLVPILPLIHQLSRGMVVYLGNDYEQSLLQANGKWLGWSVLYRFSTEYTLKIASVVIARGKYLADRVRKFNQNVVETVPLGHLNLRSKTYAPDSSVSCVKRVLYLGQVLWRKGLKDLFLAMQLVVHNYPEVTIVLDVVGDGADRQATETFVQNMKFNEYIKFHGWVDAKEKLSAFFQETDVLVVPSSSYPEGVPRVIDEALSQGVPVIATRVGGITKEFTDEEIMLIDPNSPQQIAVAIAAILFDTKTRERYITNAQRRLELWTKYGSAAQQHKRILLREREN
jgi:glycosyltransferase involved in cell wall biosynthesis